MPYRLAADIGGTFTDVVMLDIASGTCTTSKVPTTLDDLADGIVAGFDRVTDGDYSDVLDIVHGTTHGLNALIERTGARTAVVTTRGFRDSYEIGRGNHPEMYNARYRKPRPLVTRRDIFELSERLAADGSIERDVTDDELREVARAIDGRYESIAVCLLHSVANPAHERRVWERLAASLNHPISSTLSSEVSAERREFERFSTAILNAYVAPAISRYLRSLEQALADRGFRGRLAIMNSNGGRMSIRAAGTEPVRTLMSGPVGGVIGTAAVGAALGVDNLIAVDMGGTSFDVSMLSGGALDISLETDVEDVPVMVPTVKTVSVGAGGGSIAWTQAEAMRVGPRSSGAVPGPICYGRGGSEPTVTDANLVLGRIDRESFLGGAMTLEAEAPLAAFAAYGDRHALSTLEAAEGALQIANTTMADAIREITLWRGTDVQDFDLVAYGGAGPMHAALIAEELGISRVVIPPQPGAFSAWGMLHADLRLDAVHPERCPLHAFTADDFRRAEETLKTRLRARLAADGIAGASPTFERSLDLRHVGQQYAINVPLDGPFDREAVRRAFDAEYRRLYGFSTATAVVEILNVRVDAVVAEEHRPQLASVDGDRPSPVRTIDSCFDGSAQPTPVFDRAALGVEPVPGPATVVELTSTTVVPPGWSASVDGSGSLIISRDDRKAR
jgi:N-methylhydantoinase A